MEGQYRYSQPTPLKPHRIDVIEQIFAPGVTVTGKRKKPPPLFSADLFCFITAQVGTADG